MTLLRRIFSEKRTVAIPLLLALLVNALAYALVIYPLVRRSAGVADRAVEAAAAVQTAERDLAAARALVADKARAQEELATFYNQVLPPDHVAASRMTYARLPALARKANVRYEAGTFEIDEKLKNASVGRLGTKMLLQGDYESMRRFIYELETSPEFLIIDGVALGQREPGKPLTLNLELSTYYRTRPNGT